MRSQPWQAAAIPANEAQRLAQLQRYEMLDTAPEPAFDRLTRMAARRFGMPISLVTLIDEHRQWFKSRLGIEAVETSRDLAFCAHVLLADGVMVVPDATKDARFAGNPFVTDDPDIRFYAGAPLTNNAGFTLGTLCVVDRVPHPEFSEQDRRELAEFAAIAMDEIELCLAMKQAQRDLEALKEAQQALQDAHKKAERVMQEKSQFIASISHELRTPMNGILGMLYLLCDTVLDTTQREYIETINHSAKNLLLLINDVLDSSKIEAGELLLDRKPFEVATGFTQSIKLLQPMAQKKGIAVTYAVDADMPPVVVGDAGRFAQIITNLVGNAIKFTDHGTVAATLRYDALRGSLLCDVTDSGIGIPEQKRAAIFEKFVQGDAAITQKYGGTGLGLAITKQLVVMLGGEIGFESTLGVGSRFWFRLPVTLPAEGSQQPDREDACIASMSCIPVARARILVVEDHHVNQLFLDKLLRKFGFVIIDMADNGFAALERIRDAATPYDAILMDCRMPEMDGYQATQCIREEEAAAGRRGSMPIIAMTANAMAGDREDCFAAGMDEYLAKPVQPQQLKDVLSKWFAFAADESPARRVMAEELPAIDFARLDMVSATAAEARHMLAVFFELAGALVATMEIARRSEEFARWNDAVHSLKGAAANLGMGALEAQCAQCEQGQLLGYGQRSASLQKITAELARIEAQVAQAYPALLRAGAR